MGTQYQKFDVVGLGAVAVDLVATVNRWPAAGEKIQLSSLRMHDGGNVATALTAVARLGGRACFAAKLGRSEMASRAVDSLRRSDVDISMVIRSEGAEPIQSLIVTNPLDGKRTIFWSNELVSYPDPSSFPMADWAEQCSVLLLDYLTGPSGIAAAKVMRDRGKRVVLDMEKETADTAALLRAATDLVVPDDFAREYTQQDNLEKMLKKLRFSLEQNVIITCGSQGCIGLTGNEIFSLPAFAVDVVDTTGCGDVFHGAYALALARGESVKSAARFASGAAALSATKVGGRDGIPNKQDLEFFLMNRKGF